MVKSHIFWDWNGTLLNDVEVCVESMNALLTRRKLKLIDKQTYQSLFGFPVREYYLKLGFEFQNESFEEVSVEFIGEYNSRAQSGANLYAHVHEVLDFFRSKRKKQVILSAMESGMLQQQLAFYGIHHYFEDICGVDDIYAHGKKEMAQNYLHTNQIDPVSAIFIGDTLHDAEVAEYIGCELILVSHGHHTVEKLTLSGKPVLQNLAALSSFIN